MTYDKLVEIISAKKTTICLVGAGGKTSLMTSLAQDCSSMGKKVLVTTTTHIRKPDMCYADTMGEVCSLWSKGKYAVIGTETIDNKLKSPDPDIYKQASQQADLVLIEADGSKEHPCKVPRSGEPVITDDCDIVIGLMGMTAIGKPLEDICFRFNSEGAWLEEPEDAVLSPEIAAKILCDERGTRKNVNDKDYIIVLNQCDDDMLLSHARKIENIIAKNHDIRVMSMSLKRMHNKLIIVRGGGDLATGTIHRLWSAGLPVLVLETNRPAAIRRQVSVCEAVYDGSAIVEGMTAVLTDDYDEVYKIIEEGNVPVMVDPLGKSIDVLRPQIVVDAIIAKKNLGTNRSMAPVTIGLGPGFNAGVDVDYCIETKRGHNLGRIIKEGYAVANTGVPGNIGGFTSERVIHVQAAGVLYNVSKIGDIVEAGQEIAYIMRDDGERLSVKATISGILRGLLRDSYRVTEHFKIADIDPRKEELANCFTISDKARCIAGSVLELCVKHLVG